MDTSALSLFEQLHRALPQTQCQRCGYADCAAYAQAMANEEAPINRCPPGGAEGVARLARLTGQPEQPLDAECGQEGPRTVAWIDEDWCIGCTLCLQVCPTDAIVGANKAMHTVIEDECTGCELCIPVCPVDCIRLDNVTGSRTGWQAWSPAQADHALARYGQHQARKTRHAQHQAATRVAKARHHLDHLDSTTQPAPAGELDKRKALIAAALAKARAQRQA
ncbi:ferredoxin [Comamonas serinivorans]|uniref:Ferredoxin n=1 Tax=Comamonas serinivorans TaxID=1082851 RepID=A0A1Y0EPE8_9BURK|nr:RnfABCDGE type electron transport complex subunit B [Comamonas serinivorans]ARU05446.1 ferredoxin [Comamonas serinivorans]